MGGRYYAPTLLLLVLVAHLMPKATLLSAIREDFLASHVEGAIMAVQQNLPLSACRPKCRVRCSKAGEWKRCMRYCRMCCKKCRCVPPSTFGNKQDCPCYANLKNAKGGSKCP